MNAIDYAKDVTMELARTLSSINAQQGEELADGILAAEKIFIAGAGRSGFMVKAFAMRLMHMGFSVHVVGETTTPNIQQGDLLLIGSGSGETGSLCSMAKNAKKHGAKLALITIFPDSTIGKLADMLVVIDAPTSKADSQRQCASIQPMGSLFEQSLLIFLDCIILLLMGKKDAKSAGMFKNHANLE